MHLCGGGLFALVFLSVISFAETTPCSKHPGQRFSNQGSGACTGNKQLETKLSTLGFSLVYNSQAPDIGYGTGWNFSLDSAFVKTTSTNGVLYLEDGTPVPFTKVGSQWQPNQRSVYDDILTEPNSSTVRQTNVDGTVYNYTKVGTTNRFALSSVTSRKGTEIAITRNTSGLITQIRNFFGQDNIFGYDTLGKLASIKDYAGSFYYFTYTGANLTRLTYPDGLSANMEYNADSLLVKYTDPNSRVTSFTYLGVGASSVVTSITDYEGYQTNISYTANSVTVQGLGVDLTEVFSLNALGGVTIAASRNGQTDTSVFDSQGRLAQVINFFGNAINYIYSGTDPFVSEIQYPDGLRSTYVYNSKKKVTQEKIISPVATLTTDFTRNSNGQATKRTVTGPTGIKAVESYTIDSKGNLTKVVNSASKTSYTGVYNALSLITSQSSLEGYVENFTYDSLGNAITRNYSTGDSETRAYSPLGTMLSLERLPQNKSYTTQFDLIGRPVMRARQLSGGGGSIKFLSTKVYQPLISYGSSQEVFNSLILKQTNTTFDLKSRPLFIERSSAP